MPNFKTKDDYENEVVRVATKLNEQERHELFLNWKSHQMTKKQWGIFEGYRELANERSS
jgi:hypothetical protein